MIADSGNKFDFVRKFDEVVVCPESECFSLGCGFLFTGKNDEWNIF